MTIGNGNNGLLDQQIDSLLNSPGQDRLQRAQLDFGIPNYDPRILPTSFFRPTFGQRQRQRDEIIARAEASGNQRAIDPEVARQNYLDQFNKGVNALDMQKRFNVDEQRGSTIDPNIQIQVPEVVPNQTVIDPEAFVQSQISPGSSAFPVAQKPIPKKEEEESKLNQFGSLFDNRGALGKIALGVALIEGMPIDDAFAMYDGFLPDSNSKLEIEAYNPETDQIYYGAQDDPSILALKEEGYQIQPFGTRSDELAAMREANLERQTASLGGYRDVSAESNQLLRDAKRLKALLDSGEVKTGVGADLVLQAKRVAKAFGIESELGDTAVFETIINRLIPQIRPTGSGSTSNFEIDLYARALPSLNKSVEENQAILEELILATEINQKRASYVLESIPKDPDGQSVTYENEYSDTIDIVMNKFRSKEQARTFGFEISREELSKEEQSLIEDVFIFVEKDDLSEYLEGLDDDKDIGRLVVIGD